MHALAPTSWLYLAYVSVGIPYAAVRTARRTRSAAGPAAVGSRTHLYLQGMATQILLGGIAWYTGLLQGLRYLGPFALTPFDVVAGALTLALMLVLVGLSTRLRSEDERRRMWVLGFLPRTRGEGAVYALLTMIAPVSEELAYRGVAFALFAILTGSALAGAVLSAVAFALAHYPQGAKSMGVIFVIGLVKQALVALTGTLWIAIAVHFLHNMTVAARMLPRVREMDARSASADDSSGRSVQD